MSTYDDDYSVDDLDRITLETHTKDSRRQCVPLGRDEDWGGDGVFLDGQPDVQRRLLKGGAKFPFASWWICKDTNATEGTSPSALSAFSAWRLKTSSKKSEVTVTPFFEDLLLSRNKRCSRRGRTVRRPKPSRSTIFSVQMGVLDVIYDVAKVHPVHIDEENLGERGGVLEGTSVYCHKSH